MRQRLDIVDVEQRTKIRAKYLRALENEEWALLPGPTFVRTFLRTYAEAVGLDPHVLVEAYRTQHDEAEEPEAQQPLAPSPRRRAARTPRAPERRRPASPSGPPGPLAVLGGLVVLVLIGLLVLGLVGGGDDGDPEGQKAQQTTTTRTETTRSRPARRRPAPKPAPQGVTVKVEPTAPTYVCMDGGDGTPKVFEGILEEPRTFRNAKELRINLGKRAVKVTANGKPVTIAPSAEPLGLRVTRTEAGEITEGPRPCA